MATLVALLSPKLVEALERSLIRFHQEIEPIKHINPEKYKRLKQEIREDLLARLRSGEFKPEENEQFWYETPRVVRPLKWGYR